MFAKSVAAKIVKFRKITISFLQCCEKIHIFVP